MFYPSTRRGANTIPKLMEHIINSHIMANTATYSNPYNMASERVVPLKHSCYNSQILVLDVSKAFDKVSHSLLLHKLNHYGIKRNTHCWIQAFLNGRTQSIVPQGSVLGSILLIYYINDIAYGLDATVRLFADDTIVYLTIAINSDSANLKRDIDGWLLAQWKNKWNMAFHPDKCQVLSISQKKTTTQFDNQLHN